MEYFNWVVIKYLLFIRIIGFIVFVRDALFLIDSIWFAFD